MKNRFIVTITDINGSKQYNIHQYMKRIVLYIVLLVVVIFFFSFISIQLLLKEVKQIEDKRNLMQREYSKINEKNQFDQNVRMKNPGGSRSDKKQLCAIFIR